MSLRSRSARSTRSLRIALIGAGLLGALALPHVFDTTLERHLLVLIAMNVALVASLDLLIGYTGLLSLAHAGFLGIGAYTSALLVKAGFPFLGALLLAGGVAWACGLVLGYPALRLRGHYFVVVTFISGIVITILMNVLSGLTRGPHGIPGIPFASLEIPGLFAYTFNPFRDKLGYYYLVLALALLVLGVKERLVRSRFGEALIAIREDEDLAQAVGVRTHRYKVAVFALSTGIAGMVGSLFAHYVTFISPESFTFRESFDLFVMNLVGGAGSTLGPILGPAFLTLLNELTRQVHPAVSEILFGVLLILTVAFLPQGLVGGLRGLRARLRPEGRPAEVPSAPPVPAPAPAKAEPNPATLSRPESGLDFLRSPAQPPSGDRGTALLRVERVIKDFGGFRAVAGVSFDVRRGEIVGLVGPNGAGKTTLFNVITGFLRPTSGRVLFEGREITRWAPHERARLGIVRTFQNTKVFPRLTVEQNVRIGCHLHPQDAERRTEAILGLCGLSGSRHKAAADLPYGEQRVLEIAIALGAGPKLLLLDEPFAGMNPAEAERCMGLLHRLRELGITVLIVDHHMETLVRHCDRLVVLHHGEKLVEGKPDEVKDDPRVIEVYLGRSRRRSRERAEGATEGVHP